MRSRAQLVAAWAIGSTALAACRNSPAVCGDVPCERDGGIPPYAPDAAQSPAPDADATTPIADASPTSESAQVGAPVDRDSSSTNPPQSDAESVPAQDAAPEDGRAVMLISDAESGAPGCGSDADCQDSQACNGTERCVEGVCRPGAAMACPSSTQCVEGTKPGCAYPSDEWFYAYVNNGVLPNRSSLVGIPLSTAPNSAKLDLSAGTIDEMYFSFGDVVWSPNGRFLVFDAYWTDFANGSSSKTYWLDVTAPLPFLPRRVPDVPVVADLTFRRWSADSQYALIGDPTSLYAVHFAAGGPVTARVTSAAPDNASAVLCAEGLVAFAQAGATRIVSPWTSAPTVTTLPYGLVSGSPDGRWLLLSDSDANGHAFIAPCALNAKPEALGPATDSDEARAGWSPGSKYLAYHDATTFAPAKGTVWRVASTATHTPLLEYDADTGVLWEDNGDHCLYRPATGTSAPWTVSDLKSTTPAVALAIPAASSPQWLGTGGKVVYPVEKAPGVDYDVVDIAKGAKPKLLLHCAAYAVTLLGNGSLALCTEPSSTIGGAQGEQMFVLDLSQDPPTRRALFASPPAGGTLSRVASAKDGTGQRLLIEHTVGSGSATTSEIFVAHSNSSSEPVRALTNGAISPYDTYVQPRP